MGQSARISVVFWTSAHLSEWSRKVPCCALGRRFETAHVEATLHLPPRAERARAERSPDVEVVEVRVVLLPVGAPGRRCAVATAPRLALGLALPQDERARELVADDVGRSVRAPEEVLGGLRRALADVGEAEAVAVLAGLAEGLVAEVVPRP